MVNGKVRSLSHIIDQEAIKIVLDSFPVEWVVRNLTPDYGLDLDVELFDKEQGNIVTIGERLFVQVKGCTNPKYKSKVIDHYGEKITIEYISFSLDTSLLKLVERIGKSLPILLVFVDISKREAFFLNLNDVVYQLAINEIEWRNQDEKTIHIPCSNNMKKVNLLRWYALRPKLNTFFSECSALKNDLEYEVDPENFVHLVKKFSRMHVNSDVWNCSKSGFTFLDRAHELMKLIVQGDYSKETEYFFHRFSKTNFIDMGRFESLSFNLAKNLFMSNELLEELENANSIMVTDLMQDCIF